jgi:hypothetical protein
MMFTVESCDGRENLAQLAELFLPYSRKALGWNKPIKVKMVADPINAMKPFGKTAYYDFVNERIVLFVENRHDKDVLRSLSHELVHHAQNCRGEFDRINAVDEGYAQHDAHLRAMELEAYQRGNMVFRDFEDGLKKEIALYEDDDECRDRLKMLF